MRVHIAIDIDDTITHAPEFFSLLTHALRDARVSVISFRDNEGEARDLLDELRIRFDRLIREGHIEDYAELARLGHVTRSRLSQIMALLQLAPDIQEGILFLPLSTGGHDSISERTLRPIAALPDWRKQRCLWRQLASIPRQ